MMLAEALKYAAEFFDPTPSPWAHDPAGWIRGRTNEHVWSGQERIVGSVVKNRYTMVVACHGPGKSFIAARTALWWIDSHPPGEAVVVTSAPTWPQVKAILWREMRDAHRKAKLRGRINLSCEYVLDDGSLVAFGRKPADQDEHGFQGVHARYLLVILDEACGIPAQLFDAVQALMTNEDSRLLAIGNPDDPQARFAELSAGASPLDTDAPDDEVTEGISRLGANVVRIPLHSTPNFTGEPIPPELKMRLPSTLWEEEAKRLWGETSPRFTSKALARFPEITADGVVPWSWAKACQGPKATQLVGPLRTPRVLGVDFGAGGDLSVARLREGPRVGKRWQYTDRDSAKVVEWLIGVIRESDAERVNADTIGIGWGVLGHLRSELARIPGLRHVEVCPVNVAEAADDPSKYVNLRAQMWWEVGRELSRTGGWDLTEIDEATMNELTAPRYRLDKAGRIVVESKDELRKPDRLGRSTDDADALLMSFLNTEPLEAQSTQYEDRRLQGRR